MNPNLKLLAAFVAGLALALALAALWWPSRAGQPAAVPRPGPASVAPPAAISRADVKLADAQARRIGLQVAPVSAMETRDTLKAIATVVPDESRITHIHTRVSGWVDRLHVPNTGGAVRLGQPLVDIFSQELYAAQVEHLAARAFSGPPSAVLDSGRARLKTLGMSERDIDAIERSGQPRRVVTLYASGAGILAHRGVAAGTAVDPSTEIGVILDLSRVWAIADVPVAAMQGVATGQPAQLQFGDVARTAKVEFIEPIISESRTLKVRFSLDNRDGALRPGMYGTASLIAPPRKVLTVPREAVVDTGDAQYVYLQPAAGTYVPHQVKVGNRAGGRAEILDGLDEGAQVVVAGVFLLDSESRLRASGGQGAAHGGHGGGSQGGKPATTAGEGGHQHD